MKKSRNGLGKFILGAGIGAALGALLTKNNGAQNREALKLKIVDLSNKLKSLDSKEIRDNIQSKMDEIMLEISELDKEKVVAIAKKKASQIKTKSEELVEYVVEKGTPVIEKSANLVKEKAIEVTKEILRKLESEEK